MKKGCPHCDYTEWSSKTNSFCSCYWKRLRVEMMGEELAGVNLSSIIPANPNQSAVLERMRKEPDKSYYLYGMNESGKSYIIAGLFNFITTQNGLDSYRWLPWYKIEKEVYADINNDVKTDYIGCIQAGVIDGSIRGIFIDDFGKGRLNDTIRAQYDRLIDTIYLNPGKVQLVITAECDLGYLAQVDFSIGLIRRIKKLVGDTRIFYFSEPVKH